MRIRQPLQPDGKLHVTRAHNVLNLELGELGIEAKLLYDARIFPGRKAAHFLTLGSSTHHLSTLENQRRRLVLFKKNKKMIIFMLLALGSRIRIITAAKR